ncbi:MAG: O-antigen ligase family protein [Verrucomicrobiota bacterium]|nr:O-antigen ligase family protein [Verrucomicrobiota bacterium]
MRIRERFPAFAEGLSLFLLLAGFGVIQALIGGTRMVFCLPAYLLVGAAGMLLVFSMRRTKPAPCRLCLAVTALFFAYIIARALLSPVPYIARSDLYSAITALVVYFSFSLILTSGTARIVFVCGLLVFALAHVIVGAVQFRDGLNFMPISWLRRYDYGNRASGFYICPNHLAGFLEVIAILGLSVVCWSRWRVWAKLLIAYAVACCYAGLLMTGSRGGFLSATVSLLVFVVLSLVVLRRTTRKLFWQVTLVSLSAALILGGLATLFVTHSQALSGRAQVLFETTNIRRELWSAALDQWQVSPIVGTGSGTYLYYGRFFRTLAMQRDPVFVHNDYLHLLAEYGLIGAIGMACLVVVHLRRGFRNFARLGPKRVAVSERLFSNGLALNIGAISAIAAYAVHEALDFNLHIPANVLLLAFVFGILANDGAVRDRDLLPVSGMDFLWRLGVPALALTLMLASARLLPGEYYSEKARVAVRDNQPGVALLNGGRGLQYDPRNPDLYRRLGSARMQLGDLVGEPQAAASFYNDAALAFENAHAIAPQDEVYLLQLAGALDAAKRFDEAEWRLEQALQLDPHSESLLLYYKGHLELWRGPAAAEPQP